MVYPIARISLVPAVRLWIRKVNGLEKLKEPVFIFAANHGSFADDLILPTLLMNYLNRYVHMYCNDRFYKNFFLRKFLEWGRCIPVRVDESTAEAKRINEKAFQLALHCLKKKEIVGIFPEGHRSIDGSLMKAKTGVAKLALTAQVPVIPIGSVGTHEIMPKGAKVPGFKRCEINIGRPMHLNKYFGKEKSQRVLNHVTRVIMERIAGLAGLEYRY